MQLLGGDDLLAHHHRLDALVAVGGDVAEFIPQVVQVRVRIEARLDRLATGLLHLQLDLGQLRVLFHRHLDQVGQLQGGQFILGLNGPGDPHQQGEKSHTGCNDAESHGETIGRNNRPGSPKRHKRGKLNKK